MPEFLPEDVNANTPGHPGFHETIHRFVNRGGGRQQIEWSGDAVVSTGTRQIRILEDGTLSPFNFSATQAPAGAAIIFDILRDGVSIFSSPPQIAIGATHVEATPVVDAVLADDRLTINITQVGSTVAGGPVHVLGYAVAA